MKKGHAVDAHFLRRLDFGDDQITIGVGGEQRGDNRAIEASFFGDIEQHRVVADIAAFLEIGREQGRDDLVLRLAAFDHRPMDQPMRIERVRADLDRFEIEGDADLSAEIGQHLMRLRHALLAAELFGQRFLLVDAFLGIIGIEPVRPPVGVDADLVLHLGNGKLQPRLAEIAPRADDIRDDVDGDTLHDDLPYFCVSPKETLGRGVRPLLLGAYIPPYRQLIAVKGYGVGMADALAARHPLLVHMIKRQHVVAR